MITAQCGVCLLYKKELACEAFPGGIPEVILTGQVDHSKPHKGDHGKRFLPKPEMADLLKAEMAEAVNAIRARDNVAYRRVKAVLQRKGYREADFEEGGPLYGYSVNELVELARENTDATN